MKPTLMKYTIPMLIAQALFAGDHDFRTVREHVLDEERAVLTWQRDLREASLTHKERKSEVTDRARTALEEHNRAVQIQRRLAILANY